jgi:hypothetical protein
MPLSLTAEEKRLRHNECARKYRKLKKEKKELEKELKKKKEESNRKNRDRQRERRAEIKLKNMNGIISTPSTRIRVTWGPRTPDDQPTPMATPVGKEIVSRSSFLSPREQWAVDEHKEQLTKADKRRIREEEALKDLPSTRIRVTWGPRTPDDQPTPMATPVGKEIVSRSSFLSPREQ